MKEKSVLCLLVVSSLSFGALKFKCKTGVTFDSALPLFEEGNHVTLLSSNNVCGLKADFTSTCKTNLIQQGDEYNYSWRCNDAFGDLYFTSQSGGSAEFRCSGDSVATDLQSRTYQNCDLIP